MNLADNRLSYVAFEDFELLPNLRMLHMAFNHLVDVDVKTVIEKFPKLEEISLNENPFDCERVKDMVETFSALRPELDVIYKQVPDGIPNENFVNNNGNISCLPETNVEQFITKSGVYQLRGRFDNSILVPRLQKLEDGQKAIIALVEELQKKLELLMGKNLRDLEMTETEDIDEYLTTTLRTHIFNNHHRHHRTKKIQELQ